MKSPLLIAFFLLMFTMQLSQAQAKKIEYYANGQNGIELISKSKFGLTLIISTYNAKLKIKDEVAKLFYERYQKNNNMGISHWVMEVLHYQSSSYCYYFHKKLYRMPDNIQIDNVCHSLRR